MAITPFGAVVLLLHCDDAANSATLADATRYAQPAQCYGTCAPSTVQSMFGGSSAKTGNANGNCFAVGTNQNMDFGAADFTIETFLYPVSQGADGGAVVGRWNGANNDFLLLRDSDGALRVFINGAQLFATSAGALPFNAFSHVALTRYNGVITAWVNGVDKGHADFASAINFTRGLPLYFGQASQAGGDAWLEAYYDEIRVSNGLAQYTSAFTPPAAPFGVGDDADPFFNNVSLLLHFDGDNGSQAVIDSSINGLTVAVQGNAVLSTDGKLYGSASLLLDGNNSFLTIPNSDGFSFGTGDCTLELSVKWSRVHHTCFMQQSEATGGYILKWTFGWYSGRLTLSGHNPATSVVTWIAADWAPAANTQYHIACVKRGTSFSMYVDGQQIGAAVSGIPMPAVSSPLYIGRFYDSPLSPDAGNMDGRFDEIRITKGVAREVATYAPPIGAFPNKAGGTVTVKPRITRLLQSALNAYTHRRPLASAGARPGSATLRVHDHVNGGKGSISGTVTVNGTPSRRQLRLFVARSGMIIAQTWSTQDGAYSFKGIAPDREYFVVGHDYMRIYNAEVQDMLTPEVAA